MNFAVFFGVFLWVGLVGQINSVDGNSEKELSKSHQKIPCFICFFNGILIKQKIAGLKEHNLEERTFCLFDSFCNADCKREHRLGGFCKALICICY